MSEFATLWPKIKELTEDLPEPQKELLAAIFWLAWAATAQEKALEEGFVDSFTPEQATLLQQYSSGSGAVVAVPRLIKASSIRAGTRP
ncbi:hypothetical protein [Amycolatopsis kentuckyensis]|uniref:hypothetical protein n=1 Tax=Amycolatopsis kentuckyensis TaxID=218823 RepID=UPI000A36EF1F|nr:hypothetical protein [Amycolatopsis kentuckyensis]